jgi:hypothetical protein
MLPDKIENILKIKKKEKEEAVQTEDYSSYVVEKTA